MKVFPAIDIYGGMVVRLSEGDYNQVKKYSDDPIIVAQNFRKEGATCLHVVDLDGAKNGNADNAQIIKKIVTHGNMYVEVGGGIRDLDTIKKYLDCGVDRLIIGTQAVKNFQFVEDAISRFGDKIAVSVDAKNGKVAINGWTEVTEINSVDFCIKLRNAGISHVIYTDIGKDGRLSGTNIKIYDVLCQIEHLNIIASGGITYLEELEKLKQIGAYGVILGKALYENKIDLGKAIKIAEE